VASNSAAVNKGARPNSVILASSGAGSAMAKARNILAEVSASGEIASIPASVYQLYFMQWLSLGFVLLDEANLWAPRGG
jgi:hypothetical protein